MKIKILTTILMLCNLFSYAIDYNAKAIISKDKAFVGDVLMLNLIISSESALDEVSVASDEKWSVKKLKDFELVEDSQNTYSATYQFVPIVEGELKIPSIVTKNAEGQNFISNTLIVETEQPENSEEMLFATDYSPKKVFVGQVVNIKYIWKSLHPLNTIKSVNIDIPNFEDSNFKAFPNTNYINSDDKSAIGLPVHNQRLIGKTQIMRYDDTRRAYCVSFETLAIPLNAGKFEIKAPSIICAVPKDKDVSAGVPQRFTEKRFLYPAYFDNEFFNYQTEVSTLKKQFVKAKSLDIEVLPLPLENMPENFTYIIGEYKISASLPETSVRVGDTLDLEVVIEALNDSSLATVKLNRDNFSARGFDKFEIPEEFLGISSNNKKIFKLKLLVNSIESNKIPAMSFSFFNPNDEKYCTLETQEIFLTVSPSQSARILAEDGSEILIKTKLTKNVAGIYDTQVDENFFSAQEKPFIGDLTLAKFLLIALVIPLIFLALFIVKTLKNLFLSSAKLRNRLAFYLKLKSISLKSEVSTYEIEAIIQELFSVYIKTEKNSMTFIEINELLVDRNCPESLIEEMSKVFQKLRANSYSDTKANSENKDLLKHTIKLLKKINRNLK